MMVFELYLTSVKNKNKNNLCYSLSAILPAGLYLESSKMAEAGWDDVTYLKKRAPRAAESKSEKVQQRCLYK